MYINSGYYHNSHQDFKDKSKPLVVGSCGNYRVLSHPKMPTYRPRGRLDYQIIYIASGKAHFHFDNAENETRFPSLPETWFYTGRRNFKNMNITAKIKQRYSGSILPEVTQK